MEYPISSTAKVYYDLDGNPRTLHQMVAHESEWAVSRIKEGEKAIAQRDQLREALQKIDADLEGRNFLESSSLRDTARAALKATEEG